MAESYTVTSQVERQKIGASGQLVPTRTVYFTTKPHGLSGSVDVPEAQADPETVNALITAKVDNMLAIQGL